MIFAGSGISSKVPDVLVIYASPTSPKFLVAAHVSPSKFPASDVFTKAEILWQY